MFLAFLRSRSLRNGRAREQAHLIIFAVALHVEMRVSGVVCLFIERISSLQPLLEEETVTGCASSANESSSQLLLDERGEIVCQTQRLQRLIDEVLNALVVGVEVQHVLERFDDSRIDQLDSRSLTAATVAKRDQRRLLTGKQKRYCTYDIDS